MLFVFFSEVVSCASSHPCNYDNGGCEHMCNPAGSYGRCSCKEGFRLEADGKSCLGRKCYRVLRNDFVWKQMESHV